jgi:hypothetical protein
LLDEHGRCGQLSKAVCGKELGRSYSFVLVHPHIQKTELFLFFCPLLLAVKFTLEDSLRFYLDHLNCLGKCEFPLLLRRLNDYGWRK